MILADTSVWISFLKKDNEEIHYLLKKYLQMDEVVANSAVFGELFQGVKNKRERKILELIWDSLSKPAEEHLFIKAGLLSNSHKLYAMGVGLIDCYILAACVEHQLSLWTLDKKLQEAFEIVTS